MTIDQQQQLGHSAFRCVLLPKRLAALEFLRLVGASGASRVAAHLEIQRKPAVSILDELKVYGMVSRADDGATVTYTLTEQGIKVLEAFESFAAIKGGAEAR